MTTLPVSAELPSVLGRPGLRNLRRFVLQPLPAFGIAILVAWIIISIFAGLLAPYNPNLPVGPFFQPPSSAHWFGTDEIGRDVLSRVIYGSRVSIPTAFIVVIFSLGIGGTLGAIAGYLAGWVDEAIMRFADLIFAFPTIILAMAVTAALGPGLKNAVIAVIVVSWPTYARVTRGLVLSFRGADFVSASRLLGASGRRSMMVEIMPNISGPILVLAVLDLARNVLLLASLSFLGLGVQPPTSEWGSMVALGAQHFYQWWLATFPGLAIFTCVLGFNLVGDAMRDALDPRIRSSV